MDALTAFDLFCFFCFATMSVLCALGAISGYGNSRDTLDKAISIVVGGAASYGFAQLVCETLGRLRSA
jgi:hypothetical protein